MDFLVTNFSDTYWSCDLDDRKPVMDYDVYLGSNMQHVVFKSIEIEYGDIFSLNHLDDEFFFFHKILFSHC